MKTSLALILFLLFSNFACAQTAFAKADSLGAHFDEAFLDMPDLAQKLTKPFHTEAEKARVLYMWIAHHIAFDVQKYENPPALGRFVAKTEKELQQLNQHKLEKELLQTLTMRKGVCQDYSNLYKAMCKAAGLECLTVTGISRDFFKPSRSGNFPRHTWNVVKIAGKWELVDATWGAGYVMNGHFIPKISPGFFMTPPGWFAQGHLPKIIQWQLLEEPVMMRHFSLQPLVNIGQQHFPLLDFSPQLEKSADGLAQLRFKFERMPEVFMVVNGHSGKQVLFAQTIADGWVSLHFPIANLPQVTVYMGDRNGTMLEWLAKYDAR